MHPLVLLGRTYRHLPAACHSHMQLLCGVVTLLWLVGSSLDLSLSFLPSAPRTASQALEGKELKVFHTYIFSHQERPLNAEDVSQGRRGYGPGGMENQGARGGGWKSRAGTKPQEAYCFEKGMGGLSSASSTLVLLFPDQQKSICRG